MANDEARSLISRVSITLTNSHGLLGMGRLHILGLIDHQVTRQHSVLAFLVTQVKHSTMVPTVAMTMTVPTSMTMVIMTIATMTMIVTIAALANLLGHFLGHLPGLGHWH